MKRAPDRLAQMIIEVRAGRRTATSAARELGISRKTYYGWESRALEGMMRALEHKAPGRTRKRTDPEKEALQRQVRALSTELELQTQRDRIRAWLSEPDAKKKERKRRRDGGHGP